MLIYWLPIGVVSIAFLRSWLVLVRPHFAPVTKPTSSLSRTSWQFTDAVLAPRQCKTAYCAEPTHAIFRMTSRATEHHHFEEIGGNLESGT